MIDHKELFFKPGVSPTSINEFVEKPSLFWKHSSLNPNKVKKDTTPAMTFGRLVHCLVLTPEMFEQDFAVLPTQSKDDLDTVEQLRTFITDRAAPDQKIPSKAKKDDLIQIVRMNWPDAPIWDQKVKEFYAAAGKKTVVTIEQMGDAKSMQDAMFANRGVRNLIGNGMSESPFCWFPDATEENPQAGIMRKVKMDYHRSGLVIEYKTDMSPCELDFSRTIAQRGYHRQLATQVDAATRLYGERPRGAIIIAQDKDMHDDIAIYALKSVDIETGFAENNFAMSEIKRRMELMQSGVPEKQAWRSFTDDIKEISLPRWYQPKTA